MNHIVKWEQYCSLYDYIKEDEFDKAEAKAELEVKAVIGPRWENITETTYGYDQLVNCICQVMNQQAINESKGIGTGVSSVSNDGYSESYVNGTAADAKDSIASLIKRCLSGTGLVGAY